MTKNLKAKELTAIQTSFLESAQKLSKKEKSLNFDKDEVRNFLGYQDENNSEQLQKILEIEDYLLTNNFIQKTPIPNRFEISKKGVNYLKWKKKQPIRSLKNKINEVLNHDYARSIIKALFFLCGFVIVEQFVFYVFEKNEINKIIQPLIPNPHSSKTIVGNLIFIILTIVLIARNIKDKFTFWEFSILFIYLYFRLGNSHWIFFSFFQFFSFNILYIDVVIVYYLCCLIYMYANRYKRKIAIEDDSYLTLDLPLKELSVKLGKDLNEVDDLGRNRFAFQIAEEISHLRPYRAFAVGINGPWGSGKTSLIDLIINKIKNDDYDDKIKVIEFYPWLSKDSEHLISNFLSLFEKSFRNNRNLVKDIENYSKAISAIEKKIFDTEFSALKDESKSDIRTRYNAVITELEREKKLVIIKIDDLDRLTAEEIIDTLRLIRIIADFPNTVYLVGYDKDYVDSAIKEKLTKEKPEQYIHKVFNVEFKIPETRPTVIDERLRNNIERQVELLVKKSLIAISQQDQINLFFKSNHYKNVSPFIANERDIIRFTNNLLMKYLPIRSEVNFEDFFLLELINYKYPETYLEIYRNKDKLVK